MPLADFQKFMNKVLLSGEFTQLESAVKGGGQLSAKEALGVYRNGYFARLTESLGDTFESVWWVLGDEDFFKLCREYILSCPSKSYNLNDFGESFAHYIGQSSQGNDIEFLKDLARFEWCFLKSFHGAAVNENFDFSEVKEDSILPLAPQVQLFRSPYNVYEIWKHRDVNPQEAPPIEWQMPFFAVLFNQQQQVRVEPLSGPSFEIFSQLQQRKTVGDSVELAQKVHENLTPEQVSETFTLPAQLNIVLEDDPCSALVNQTKTSISAANPS